MKFTKIFAAALFVASLASSPSFASVLSVGIPTTSGQVFFATSAANSNSGFSLSGLLNPGTELTLSYTSGPVLSGSVGEFASLGSASVTNSSTSGITTSMPILTMAQISNGVGSGTITIENLTSSIQSVAASFSFPTLIASGLNVLVGSVVAVSAVPLPPAFVLFASALLVLAGFAAYKKSRGQI